MMSSLPAFRCGGLAYVTFSVDDAHRAARSFQSLLGFHQIGEARAFERLSTIVQRSEIRLIMTNEPESHAASGDKSAIGPGAIREIAFTVSDVETTFERALTLGAHPVQNPEFTAIRGADGGMIRASIAGPGGLLIHSFVELTASQDALLPGFEPISNAKGCVGEDKVELTEISHLCLETPADLLEESMTFYTAILGLRPAKQSTAQTESWPTILQDSAGRVEIRLIRATPGESARRFVIFAVGREQNAIERLAQSAVPSPSRLHLPLEEGARFYRLEDSGITFGIAQRRVAGGIVCC